MFSAKGNTAASAARLSWTPGGISLSAWQVTGENLVPLNGAVVRDSAREQPMFIISFAQFTKELHEQRQKAKERRAAATVWPAHR